MKIHIGEILRYDSTVDGYDFWIVMLIDDPNCQEIKAMNVVCFPLYDNGITIGKMQGQRVIIFEQGGDEGRYYFQKEVPGDFR